MDWIGLPCSSFDVFIYTHPCNKSSFHKPSVQETLTKGTIWIQANRMTLTECCHCFLALGTAKQVSICFNTRQYCKSNNIQHRREEVPLSISRIDWMYGRQLITIAAPIFAPASNLMFSICIFVFLVSHEQKRENKVAHFAHQLTEFQLKWKEYPQHSSLPSYNFQHWRSC